MFAHPRATRRGRVVPDELIVELAAAGLAGLEADHEDHTPAEQRAAGPRARRPSWAWWSPARRDFHGTHKTVRIGAHTTAPEAYERLVAGASGRPSSRHG